MDAPRIRHATTEDAAELLEIYGPCVEETVVSFELKVPSVEEFASRIEKSHEWLVMEGATGLLGYAYGNTHRAREAYRYSVESSVYVARLARGQGIARALYTELFRSLRDKGYHNAYAGIALPNDASLALHQALGFKKIGVFREVGRKFDQWHDVSWWQRRL